MSDTHQERGYCEESNCTEYLECTHNLYWYMGYQAAKQETTPMQPAVETGALTFQQWFEKFNPIGFYTEHYEKAFMLCWNAALASRPARERLKERVLSLPSYGLIGGDVKNPLISRKAVLALIDDRH